jgi:hypothetical protein
MIDSYIEKVKQIPEAYEKYSVLYEQYEGESNLDFIERCAVMDFDDGAYQGSVYQELYDELVGC